MADDDETPVGQEQVGADDRDLAFDALARLEASGHGVARFDGQLVTRLTRRRRLRHGVPGARSRGL